MNTNMNPKILVMILFFLIVSVFASPNECTGMHTFKDLQYVMWDDFNTCQPDTYGVNEYHLLGNPQYFTSVSGTVQFNDAGGGSTNSYYYWQDVNFSAIGITSSVLGYASGSDNLELKIYWETQFDSLMVYYINVGSGGGIWRGVDCNMNTYNSTHLEINCTAREGGTAYSGYLKYNNGTTDSTYIRIRFYDMTSTANKFKVALSKNFHHTVQTPSGGESCVGTTHWVNCVQQGVKVYSHINSSHQVLVNKGNTPTDGTGGLCKAYIIGNNNLLTIYLTYHSEDNIVMAEWGDDDGFYYFKNNTAAYVLDSNGLWWLVPPFTCDSFDDSPSIVYAIYVGPEDSDSATDDTTSFPIMPTVQVCRAEDDTYFIKTKTASSQTHLVQKIYCNGTWNGTDCINGSLIYNNTQIDTTLFNTSINLSEENLVMIKYYLNNNLRCEWNNATTTIFRLNTIQEFTDPDYSLIKYVIFILSVGISTVIPFFIVFPIAFNDIFGIVAHEQMAFITVLTGFISVISQWNGERNLKVLIFFSAFGIAVLGYYFALEGIENSSISNLETSLSNLMNDMQNFNLVGLAVSTTDAIINILLFILSLPQVVVDVLTAFLMELSPLIGSAFSTVSSAIAIGLYAYILMKAFEILSNRYLKI